MARPGTFQKGNKAAVGSGGPHKHRPVTSVIIQKLNEINRQTNRAFIFDLVDELFEQALASEKEVEFLEGKGKRQRLVKKKIRVLGDLTAKSFIIDRSDGKPVQGIGLEPGEGKVTIVFEAADEKL